MLKKRKKEESLALLRADLEEKYSKSIVADILESEEEVSDGSIEMAQYLLENFTQEVKHG